MSEPSRGLPLLSPFSELQTIGPLLHSLPLALHPIPDTSQVKYRKRGFLSIYLAKLKNIVVNTGEVALRWVIVYTAAGSVHWYSLFSGQFGNSKTHKYRYTLYTNNYTSRNLC